MKIEVLPSFPAPNFAELKWTMDALIGHSRSFQVDIVDGQYVPVSAWPFTAGGIEDLGQLKDYVQHYELEIDCMVVKPEQYLKQFIELGFRRIVIHLGSTEKLLEIVDELHQHDIEVGIAVLNDHSEEEILTALALVDYIQVMGIKEVGAQGQSFDERTLATVESLRQNFPELEIAVDGSVNATTIARLVAAGANRLAPGSAITKAEDPVAAYEQLCQLAGV